MERKQHEIEHGRFLAESGDPDAIWNWATPAGQIRAQRRGRLLIEAAAIQPGKRVLEIGCGSGLFTAILAETGAEILAVDISPDLLAYARQRNLPPARVTLQAIPFEDVPPDPPFDAVVGSSVLHHLDIRPTLERIYTLLKPGGRVAFAEPNMLNPQIWAERNIPAVRRRMGASPDETAIVRWRLARLLRTIGFSQIEIRNVDWLHPAHPAPLIQPLHRLGLLLERVPLLKEFTGSVLISATR